VSAGLFPSSGMPCRFLSSQDVINRNTVPANTMLATTNIHDHSDEMSLAGPLCGSWTSQLRRHPGSGSLAGSRVDAHA